MTDRPTESQIERRLDDLETGAAERVASWRAVLRGDITLAQHRRRFGSE